MTAMTATTGSPWLNDLETKIKAASAELTRLRQENRALAEKVEKLERRRAGGGEAKAWEGEREEIRRRVEKLAAGLERLLG
jgi:chromosome segregation ATPase